MAGTSLHNTKYGAILVDGLEVGRTHQCCHCNNHFVSIKGSGTLRGFCTRCMSLTCGAADCHECIPFEKKLDLFEKGKISRL